MVVVVTICIHVYYRNKNNTNIKRTWFSRNQVPVEVELLSDRVLAERVASPPSTRAEWQRKKEVLPHILAVHIEMSAYSYHTNTRVRGVEVELYTADAAHPSTFLPQDVVLGITTFKDAFKFSQNLSQLLKRSMEKTRSRVCPLRVVRQGPRCSGDIGRASAFEAYPSVFVPNIARRKHRTLDRGRLGARTIKFILKLPRKRRAGDRDLIWTCLTTTGRLQY